VDFAFLRQLSTCDGSNDDGGGGNKPDAHRTSSTRDPCNSHSTDMVGSIHMDNTRIRKPDNQTQFRLKLERQNVARERKQIHLPADTTSRGARTNCKVIECVVVNGNGSG